MDLSFTEGQEALRDLARQIFVARVTTDRLRALEAEREWWDRDLWAELARAHLLGFGIPDEHGGNGGGIVELCLLLEQAGRHAAPVPLWPSVIAAHCIAREGSPSHRARLLPPVAQGAAIVTAALAEPGARDASAPGARAAPDGAAWRLDGTKTFVPAAADAAAVLVPARADDGPGLFLVEPGEAVLTEQQPTGGGALYRMTLEGARGELLAPGAGPVRALHDHARAGLCALQVGVAEHALRLTAGYTAEREQFGRPLASFQAVQQRAADAYIDVEAMRVTMWHAAWRLGEGIEATDEVTVAKFWAAEGGARVLAAAQHLHGGIGVDVDYPLHRYTFLAKQIELALGGAHEQLARLGASMAKA